jgi:hypothetical protein
LQTHQASMATHYYGETIRTGSLKNHPIYNPKNL